jgi:hypothetical protein
MPTPAVHRIESVKETQLQALTWLWPGRIALGRLTLIDGDPGVGKSLLSLDLAARLTSAREMPDGYTPSAPANVLLMSAEDSVRDTIMPRLLGAGAGLERVHTVGNANDGSLVFPDGCPLLERVIQETQSRLVVLDPFFAFLGQDIYSLNDLMIRRALEPLARVAQTTDAAILLIRHLGKCGATRQAIHRGLGSIAILGMVRTAFLVGRDPDDSMQFVIACSKNNLAAMSPSLGFRIVQNGTGLPCIEWLGIAPYTADDLLQPSRRRGEAVPRAVAFLEERLADGPCARQRLLEEAEDVGLSLRTLERAKAELGIVSKQAREEGKKVWYWRLEE